MKLKIIVIGVILALTLLLVFTGCEVGISKKDRINSFLDDLNENPIPNSIRYNFSSSCQDYGIFTGTYFAGDFPTDSIPYSFAISDYDPSVITGTASGTAGSFGGPFSIEFTMTKDGSDWYILKIVLDGSNIVAK